MRILVSIGICFSIASFCALNMRLITKDWEQTDMVSGIRFSREVGYGWPFFIYSANEQWWQPKTNLPNWTSSREQWLNAVGGSRGYTFDWSSPKSSALILDLAISAFFSAVLTILVVPSIALCKGPPVQNLCPTDSVADDGLDSADEQDMKSRP
ncbi:MAG: hypothetical protein L6R28_11840 [Planctomycetes bacterium]|nr:hypothetical protein [Planctomycetota bacterium]